MTILYNNVVLQDIVEADCTPFSHSFQYLVWRILQLQKQPKMTNPNGVLPLVESFILTKRLSTTHKANEPDNEGDSGNFVDDDNHAIHNGNDNGQCGWSDRCQ